MAKYWLMKSEPNVYSIDDLKKDKTTYWNGVRNYQARNNMMEMKKNDLILFYHSNAKPSGIVGIAKVITEAYPDFTALDKKSKYYDPKASKENPRWYMVDICFVKKFSKICSLKTLKKIPSLKEMILLNNPRLSVQSVTKQQFFLINQLPEGA